MNDRSQRRDSKHDSTARPGQISDDRLEEIKIEHYNRKMMGNTGQNNEKHIQNLTHDSKDNEKGISSENHPTRNSQNPVGQINSSQRVIDGSNQGQTKYGYWSPEKQNVLDNYSAALQLNQ